ncbi:MAG: SDR family oxidoreductase [Acidimicrobiales bacterium]
MILIAGGTGTLGTRIVGRLAVHDRVRVLTRDLRRAALTVGGNVEVVEGDVRDAATLVDAVSGVDTVIAAVHGFAGPGGVTPKSVDRDGNANLITAASRAGATFVLVSIVGAAPDSPMELFREKFAAEQCLRQSELTWTIVRATAYMETWATIMSTKPKTLVFGRGENPINFVSATDVAALIEHVVLAPPVRGDVIELGGPDNLTFNEFAATFQQVRGRLGTIRHIPRPMLRLMANVTRKLNPPFARKARAAILMDTIPMTFDASAARRRFPDVPITDLTTVLKHLA